MTMTAATGARATDAPNLPDAGPTDLEPIGDRLSDAGSTWEHERGDVPGWVLVTIMTAGLVLALWAIAGPALTSVFESAIARVTGFGG